MDHVIEGLMFLAGVTIYARATRAKDAVGKWGFWSYVAALVAFYLLSILSPPPPSIPTLAIAAIFFAVLLIAWPWWFDRHRNPS